MNAKGSAIRSFNLLKVRRSHSGWNRHKVEEYGNTCTCSQTSVAAMTLQELHRELEARAAAAAAAGAELARLRARADEADAAEAANAAVARDNAALRRQLDEVMLSHEAAVQSKDRALAQVLAS